MIAEVFHGHRDQAGHRPHRGRYPDPSVSTKRLQIYGIKGRPGHTTGKLDIDGSTGRLHHIRDRKEFIMNMLPWIRLTLLLCFLLINILAAT